MIVDQLHTLHNLGCNKEIIVLSGTTVAKLLVRLAVVRKVPADGPALLGESSVINSNEGRVPLQNGLSEVW
jgi:hypothetical protein